MIGLAFERPVETVVCLGAHPDDIEIGAAGLLSILSDSHETSFRFAIVAGTEARIEEARASASDLLGERVELAVGGFADGYLPFEDPAGVKDFLRKTVGDADPDLVVAPHVGDAHQDHRLIGEMAHQLFRNQPIIEYEIVKLDGDLGRPGFYVPLTAAQAEEKLAHLETHFESQHSKSWYRRETFAALMRIRGIEGLAPDGFAEAFHARRLSLA